MTHPYCTFNHLAALPGNVSAIPWLPPLNMHIQQRCIANTDLHDARGPYPRAPIGSLTSSDSLVAALEELGLVSLVLVSDALEFMEAGSRPLQSFEYTFPYKQHAIIDLDAPTRITKHHRREIRRASHLCSIRPIELKDYLNDWCELYAVLIARHQLTGLHRFSRSYFEELGKMVGVTTVGAFLRERLVGAHIWVRSQERVHSHLACFSPEGYRVGASYALHADASERFSDAKLIDLGAVPDQAPRSTSGLERFKRGFANASSISWLCGAVGDPDKYEMLCRRSRTMGREADFFPPYRCLESPYRG